MTKRPTNSAVARGIGTSTPKRASWDAYDKLPRDVRAVLWEAPVSINPLDAANLVDIGGIEQAVEALIDAIRQEVAMFATQHQILHGQALPHVAADATMQRYEERVRPARPKRRGLLRTPAARRSAPQSDLPTSDVLPD